MKKKICFIQGSLGGGGAERVISVLAGKLACYGYEVEIALYGEMEVAYDLDEKVTVRFLGRENYRYKSIWEHIAFRMRIIFQRYFVYAVCAIISFVVKPVWKKPTVYFGDLKKRHARFNRIIEPIRNYIDNNPGSTFVSFMWPCCSFVFQAVGKHKKNMFIFSERDDPASIKDSSSVNMRNRAYLMADTCVFQTEDARDYFSDGIRAKGHVIPNPVKEGLPGPYAGERRKVIVNFCRLTRKKNLPLLIDAFSLLADAHPDYSLHIYGKGELREELMEHIAGKKMEQRILILDHRSDIHDAICDCAMFVSSSDYEGLSNSMIEAMAMGMPVVCTDCPAGGAGMFIEPYHNGILTPVGDADALYKAMKYMIENPEKAAQMAMNASKLRDDLSVDRIAARWNELFNAYQKGKCDNVF